MEIRQNRPTSLTLEAFREELELEKTLYFFNLITFLKPGDSIEYKTECERATFSLNKIKAFEEEIEWQFSIKSEILISEVDSDTL